MRNPLFAPKWTRAFLIGLLLALYVPFSWMLLKAFGGPADWGLQWFREVFANEAWMQALRRSLFLAVANGAVATILGLGAAVASRSRLGSWIEFFSIAALVLPELVFALSLLSWFVWLGLELSLLTVLISHVTFSLSFSFYLINGRFRQIDDSLFEAAEDLGARPWTAFRRVTLPLLGPSLGVSFLICALLSFDDFLISFFVSGAGSDTLPIKLYASMKMGLSPQLHALATLLCFVSAGALALTFGSGFVQQFFQIRVPQSAGPGLNFDDGKPASQNENRQNVPL